MTTAWEVLGTTVSSMCCFTPVGGGRVEGGREEGWKVGERGGVEGGKEKR